jgi:hypothetical protein
VIFKYVKIGVGRETHYHFLDGHFHRHRRLEGRVFQAKRIASINGHEPPLFGYNMES